MCVKLIKNEKVFEYDENKPLKEQLRGCTQVLFDCKPNDVQLYKFFQEMQKVIGDISMSKVATLISSNLRKTEEKIDEISLICANRE